MKTPLLLALLAALTLAGPLGCKKQEATVDTAQVESAFATAEPGLKGDLDRALNAIKAGNWSEAGTSLQSLASNVKLSETQKSSLLGLLEQIKAKAGEVATEAKTKATELTQDAKAGVTEAAEKAKEATGKAVEDASKAVSDLLPKK